MQVVFGFCSDGHALSMRFWTFLHDSLGHMGRWHSKCFVLCPQRGASENCSWKRIYLLSLCMNKAFHHLAAVLHWAFGWSAAFTGILQLIRGSSTSFSSGQNLKNSHKAPFFSLSQPWFSLSIKHFLKSPGNRHLFKSLSAKLHAVTF